MPTLKDVRLKLAMNNYLILNNEHKIISFTYFRSYDYSTMDLFEVGNPLNIQIIWTSNFEGLKNLSINQL